MDGGEVFDELSAIIRGVFQREDMAITPRTSAASVPGWDSFKMIEILMAVEERYGIVLETRDLDHVHNVGDLALRIADKRKYSAG